MMKIKKIRNIVVFIGVIMLGVLFMSSCQNGKKQINNDYPQITDKNHVFEKTTVEEVNQKLTNKDDFYLIMGFSSCPWCQALMPELNDTAKQNKVKIIYYLDIKEIRDNKEAEGYDLFQTLTNFSFKEIVDQEKNRVNAPTFVKIVNGEVVKHHLNTVSGHIKNENGVLPPLSTEQKIELKNILNSFFN